MHPIALVCSVALETDALLGHLSEIQPLNRPTLDGWQGRLGGQPVLVITAGMGKANAARSLTAVLERFEVRGVIGFGVAGAYSGSDLQVGDVALATVEHYGDEGVETPDGWISCEGIGIPLLTDGERRLFNEFPVDAPALAAARSVLRAAGHRDLAGPFVTVSTCSGIAARGAALAGRYGALCETMEGAALAHVAAIYRIPFLEIRGVSNLVEDRDLSRWHLAEAAEAVAAILPLIAPAWPHGS